MATALPEYVEIPSLTGSRFAATYRVVGDETHARNVANHIAIEQTVEFPADLLPNGDIPTQIVGRVEDIVTVHARETHDVTISYAVEIAGHDLVQLLGVVYGNVSLLSNVKLLSVDLPSEITDGYLGPRFGSLGIRELIGVGKRPLLSSALKPLGLPPHSLAAIAGALARGGVDLIKDDQGLSDQAFGRFRDRVGACADAVTTANAVHGTHALYFANVTAPADNILDRAWKAKSLGATGLLICPALVGFDTMRVLASDAALGLPIMSHPSFIGSAVSNSTSGMSHGLTFGTLQRLGGADITVFPSYGGRFSFTQAECLEIAEACRAPIGKLRQILPAPGGGLNIGSVADATIAYGPDAAYLIGGGMHRPSPDLEANARAFRERIEGMSAPPGGRPDA